MLSHGADMSRNRFVYLLLCSESFRLNRIKQIIRLSSDIYLVPFKVIFIARNSVPLKIDQF